VCSYEAARRRSNCDECEAVVELHTVASLEPLSVHFAPDASLAKAWERRGPPYARGVCPDRSGADRPAAPDGALLRVARLFRSRLRLVLLR
jgi:hypothetical protein